MRGAGAVRGSGSGGGGRWEAKGRVRKAGAGRRGGAGADQEADLLGRDAALQLGLVLARGVGEVRDEAGPRDALHAAVALRVGVPVVDLDRLAGGQDGGDGAGAPDELLARGAQRDARHAAALPHLRRREAPRIGVSEPQPTRRRRVNGAGKGRVTWPMHEVGERGGPGVDLVHARGDGEGRVGGEARRVRRALDAQRHRRVDQVRRRVAHAALAGVHDGRDGGRVDAGRRRAERRLALRDGDLAARAAGVEADGAARRGAGEGGLRRGHEDLDLAADDVGGRDVEAAVDVLVHQLPHALVAHKVVERARIVGGAEALYVGPDPDGRRLVSVARPGLRARVGRVRREARHARQPARHDRIAHCRRRAALALDAAGAGVA